MHEKYTVCGGSGRWPAWATIGCTNESCLERWKTRDGVRGRARRKNGRTLLQRASECSRLGVFRDPPPRHALAW